MWARISRVLFFSFFFFLGFHSIWTRSAPKIKSNSPHRMHKWMNEWMNKRQKIDQLINDVDWLHFSPMLFRRNHNTRIHRPSAHMASNELDKNIETFISWTIKHNQHGIYLNLDLSHRNSALFVHTISPVCACVCSMNARRMEIASLVSYSSSSLRSTQLFLLFAETIIPFWSPYT